MDNNEFRMFSSVMDDNELRVFSAAPDLLSALEQLCDEWRRLGELTESTYISAVDAIAKARGGNHGNR